eukprot:TRINITY_DN51139_c0_g1_i1.p1 TRINITY_DN51139_c0_g1~~TRINITY_DN51139_c0_g1_i1.p1  ORF type:complete len:522 (-),score=85.64 TRINITY_DN51139_c0_g1_i1:49-1524(-)
MHRQGQLLLILPCLVASYRPDGRERLNISAHSRILAEVLDDARRKADNDLLAAGNDAAEAYPGDAMSAMLQSRSELELAKGDARADKAGHPHVGSFSKDVHMRQILVPVVAGVERLADSLTMLLQGRGSDEVSFGWFASYKGRAASAHVVFATCFLLTCATAAIQSFRGLSALKLALCSSLLFGVSNFLLAYSLVLSSNPERYLATKFTLSGLLVLVMHGIFNRTSLRYRHAMWKAQSLSPLIWWTAAASGLALGCAQQVAVAAFAEDRRAVTPNAAVMSCEVFFIVIFFRCYLNERPSWQQAAGVMLTFIGLVILSGKFTDDYKGQHAQNAYLLCFVVTMLLAIDSICLRIATVGGLTASPSLNARLWAIGVLGLIGLCVRMDASESFLGLTLGNIHWPLLNAVVDVLGMYCGVRSFESLDVQTGVVSAIFSTNCVVVFTLNVLLRGYVPGLLKLLGMASVLAGCLTLSLAPSPDCSETLQSRSDCDNCN